MILSRRVTNECLDYFAVFGEAHLRHLLSEYLAHYHSERPHQGLGNRLVAGPDPRADAPVGGAVVCEERLGGLLRHYRQRRRATTASHPGTPAPPARSPRSRAGPPEPEVVFFTLPGLCNVLTCEHKTSESSRVGRTDAVALTPWVLGR